MNEIETIKQAANAITTKQREEGYVPTGLYPYTDKDGSILYVRLRMDKPNGDKWIRPLSRDDDGNWTQLKEPTFSEGKPLYNQQELHKRPNEIVFIVEGEKCADVLTKLGLLATTSGGATSAKDANWQILANREVVIFPDNDNAGIRYAKDAVNMLKPLNANVRAIDVPALNLPPKGDCVDFIAQFKEISGREATSADIEALKLKTDLIQEPTSDLNLAGEPLTLPVNNQVTVNLQCAKDITPEPIHWLWNGWLAKGKLHIFAGQAGTGKTTIAIALASTITTGGRFPDGSQCPIGSVLIWSGEDSPADTLVPRLLAAGADLNKLHFVGDTIANDGVRSFDPATDMPSLMQKALTISDLALLIIDPIVNAVAGDSHKNGEVRRALQPVVDFGEKLNCAVLGITHFSKGGQGKDPLERVTGSLAFGALARIVLATGKVAGKHIFCRAKSNIGTDTGGFEYLLQEKEVETGINSSYTVWGDAVNGSARELLAEPDKREQGGIGTSALESAKTFLIELLADGEMAQKDIEADAKGAGHSWRTIRRAKDDLNIKSSKSVLDKRWYWKLPSNLSKKNEDVQYDHINYVDTLDTLPKASAVGPIPSPMSE